MVARVADTLALEQLYARVSAALPGVPQPFGWREKPRHGQTPRIIWQPGDPLGALGKIGGAKWPGRFPARPLGTLGELFTVWIHAMDPANPRDEFLQYKAARLLFDDWYAAVYHAARGTFEVLSSNWEVEHNEGRYGACIRVLGRIDAMLPDTQRERAPTDTGAVITPVLYDPFQPDLPDLDYTPDAPITVP